MNSTLVLREALLAGVVFIVGLVFDSIAEWIIHAKLLHGKEGTEPYNSHREHHELHGRQDYKSIHADESYGVAFPVFAIVTLVMAAIGLLTGYFVGLEVGRMTLHVVLVGLVMTLTTVAYFQFLGMIHRRVHEPKAGGWLEKTTFYRYVDTCHRMHHAMDDSNFCIVLPFVADWLMRTLVSPKQIRKHT